MLSALVRKTLTPRWLPPPSRRCAGHRQHVIMRKTASLQRAVNRRVIISPRMQHRRWPNLHGGAVRYLHPVTLMLNLYRLFLAFQLTL